MGKAMFRHDALAKGRYRRVPARWDTEFGRWVADFGVPRIVAGLAHDPDLRVTNQAVYEWLPGPPPHPARAMALVEMSLGPSPSWLTGLDLWISHILHCKTYFTQ